MFDYSMSGNAYNRFWQLDGLEDRVIYFLISPTNKSEKELEQVHKIWRLLYYNDINALINDADHPLPSYSQICKLIQNDNGKQDGYRIFRSPRLEDGWNEECSVLKIYIDSIIPTNHLRSLVNIGIDILTNSKIINVAVPETDINCVVDKVDDIPITIQTKSRVTILAQSVLCLLNGADVAGVGKVTFSRENSIQNQAQYGLWNNRNFEGMKLVIGTHISGVQ